LTIIAPRHPARGAAIADALRSRGLRVARRGSGDDIGADIDVYLADTLGELGLIFRLTGIALIGGSLVERGGHNPFEAARLGCVVLHGPDMSNCAAMSAALDAGGAAVTVRDAESLAEIVGRLLADPAERRDRADAAARIAAEGERTLEAVLSRLAPWLDALSGGGCADLAAPRTPQRRPVNEDARP
jgi:3-deoxy-D-manno-octulosonic-acid transferase